MKKKKDEKVENKEMTKEQNKIKELKQIENIKLKSGQKKEEKKNEKIKSKKDEIRFKKKIINEKNEVEKKELKNQNSNNKLPKNKENTDELPKTLITKKIEDNYDLLKKYFKAENYKRGDDEIIDEIINYKDFTNDKFLGFVSEKKVIDNENKNMIEDFLQRNKDDTKIRQDNNKTVNDRIKLIDESTKKKLYFNNKQTQQEFYDSFYNKQIKYRNNCKENLDKLTQKCDEDIKKYCIPEPKNKNNLDYFKNHEPVKISKYSFKAKNNNKIEIKGKKPKENSKEYENLNSNKISTKSKYKKVQSFNPNTTNSNDNSFNNISNTNDNNLNNSKNNDDKKINTKNKENKKMKKIKSGPLLRNKGMILSKKDIDDITNKLHYGGELLKIKKQIEINEENANKLKKCNFSEEKLTHSSIIILIKKLLFEYCNAIANNVYVDYTENPKLNYEQYIDILKDLYYIERDALPDDYLEEDTLYKELWNKLILFSSGPENSIESNVLLLYLLELNGFFSNEKILKELKNEINWIKLEDYDDLIANAKYIEENWRDLKEIKIDYIKKLKLEGKYNPMHCQDLFSNNNLNNKNNQNQILNINISNINDDKNHYITTLKGNTNYHLIHGYSKKNKNSENNSLFDFTNLFNENEENKHTSLSISNFSNKNKNNGNANGNNNTKNRIPLKDSYKDLITKKKIELENMKKDEELKLKEICTFKPQIHTVNKKVFSKKIKIELPKHKKNKSLYTYNNSNSITQETNTNSNINNNNNITPSNQQKNNPINSNKKNNQNNLKRNKSSIQKMFSDNPLKKDKAYIEKIEKIKMAKMNSKELKNYNNNLVSPMRFDIEYPSKFESLGITINRDANNKQRTHNVIFYNIKVNEKMKILKFNEGDDLKLNVINFVRKNNLPEEVIDIILTKIKEKTIEEIL